MSDRSEVPTVNDEPRPTKKKLTKADSPPPAKGIVRDLPVSEVAANMYIGEDVNIMFFGEAAYKKMRNGEKVILVPEPGAKWDPVEAHKRMRKRDPRLAGITRSTANKIRREWGR